MNFPKPVSPDVLITCITILIIRSFLVSAQNQYPPPPPPPPKPGQLVLNEDNINPYCRPIHDQRPLDDLIDQLQLELQQKVPKPFDRIIDVGFPNPHAMGIKPLTAIRQLLGATVLPEVVQPAIPSDIADKAKFILSRLLGRSIGSYTAPQGVLEIRQHVASYLGRRDGVNGNASQIFLANGPIEACTDLIKLVKNKDQGRNRGVLLPSPDLPYIVETVHCEEVCWTFYRKEAETGWAITQDILQAAIDEQSRYCSPIAIVVANPHVPTGRVLSREEVELVINFAVANKLIVISVEINQDTIFDPEANFISIRKVAAELGIQVEVISIISAVAGPVSEAGLRPAAYEFFYFDPAVVDDLVETLRNIKIAPNTVSQIVLDGWVNPPKKGDPSYPKWEKEIAAYIGHLRKNNEVAIDWLQETNGLSATAMQAGYLLLIKIDIPDGFVAKAQDLGIAPDLLFSLELARRKGVIVIPGSWLEQPLGDTYIGFTLLPDTKDVRIALTKVEETLREIEAEYGSPSPPSYYPQQPPPPY